MDSNTWLPTSNFSLKLGCTELDHMLCLDKDRACLAKWKYVRCSIPGSGKLNANAVGDSGGVMRLSWNGGRLVLSLQELFMLNSMCGTYSSQLS